jgi:hypothetical protein
VAVGMAALTPLQLQRQLRFVVVCRRMAAAQAAAMGWCQLVQPPCLQVAVL